MRISHFTLTSALIAGAMHLALCSNAIAQDSGTRPRANDAAPRSNVDQADRSDRRGFDPGWLGLLGLVGMLGLAGKNRTHTVDRTTESSTAARH